MIATERLVPSRAVSSRLVHVRMHSSHSSPLRACVRACVRAESVVHVPMPSVVIVAQTSVQDEAAARGPPHGVGGLGCSRRWRHARFHSDVHLARRGRNWPLSRRRRAHGEAVWERGHNVVPVRGDCAAHRKGMRAHPKGCFELYRYVILFYSHVLVCVFSASSTGQQVSGRGGRPWALLLLHKK